MNACCPYCGAEYLLSDRRCWDCRLGLEDPPEPTLPVDDPAEEAGFELDDWPAPARSRVTASLRELAIPARWEPGLVLVVREADADSLDDVLAGLDEEDWPDGDGADDDEEDSGEAAHQAMGDLFVAADRLMHEPADDDVAGDLVEAGTVVEAASRPPFGIDPGLWNKVQALSAVVRGDLAAGADEEVVAQDARTLRDTLRPLV